jgi:ribonuclease E
MPDMVHRVKRYRDDVPLFSRFQIEHQIETAYSRTVPLPSGGAIVIDHTEALVSIDVNSARATRGSDIETTAFHTNCEAADEVARQLRLRDLGGLIVIDFIDMENAKNQREVETRLKDALRYDRARVQMGKISRFGLMELSRQRLRPSLSEGSHVTCPRCNGTGHIRDTESSALQVLRIIQEEAMKENSAAIHVQAPVDVAAFLLNEKRGEILKIETRHRVTVILIPNKHLETPHYKLERIKHDDPRLEEPQASYDMAEEADTDISYGKRQKEEIRPRQEAVVKGITPDQPAPIVERKPMVEATPVPAPAPAPAEEGFFSRMFGFFRKKPVTPAPAPAPVVEDKAVQARERADRNGRGRNRGRGRGGRERGEEREASRNEGRDETAKATVGAEAQQRPPRQQREPKEAREPREGREARENREPREPREPREGGESRRERQQRQREERKETAVEELLTSTSTQPEIPSAAISEPSDTGMEISADHAGMEETAGEQGEERRRRRRRGGRNRNRREREQGDIGAGVENAADLSESAQLESTEGAMENAATVEPEAPAALEVPATTVAAPVAEKVAVTPEQPSTATAAEHVETPAEVAASSVAAPAQEAVPVPAAAPEPVPAAVAPIMAQPAPMPLDHLREILAAAGLTLAVTDPEKLRAAQEAAARFVPPPRVPRVRKPLPPVSNEPLIQVETRR